MATVLLHPTNLVTIAPADSSGDGGYTDWVETRRNLVPSPTGAKLTRYACTLGTLSNATAGEIAHTRNATGSARALEVKIGTALGSAATAVTISCEVMTKNTLTCVLRPSTASGTGSISMDVPNVPPGAGAWQRYTATAQIPAGWNPASTAGFVFVASAGLVGDVTRWRNLQVELAPAPLGGFFTGDTEDTELVRYSWAVVPDDSPSVQETRELDLPPVAKITDGTVTIDALAIPYGTAACSLPLTVGGNADDVDPRDNTRAVLFCTTDGAWTTGPGGATEWVPSGYRRFDLGIRDRLIDHEGKTVQLTLATDEALLLDYATLVEDPTPRTFETSLRDLIDYVLDTVIPGAALDPSGPDPDVTAYWSVSNMLANPDVGGGTLEPWVSGGNCTIFLSGPWAEGNRPPGSLNADAIGMTSLAGGLQAIVPHKIGQGPSVTPGRTYTLTGYARQYENTASRKFWAGLRWLSSSGVPMGPDLESPGELLSSSEWRRDTVTGTAPVGASRAEVFFRVSGGASAGLITYADAFQFYEGAEVIPFYTGDTPDDEHYSYSWATEAHASSAIRTAEVERPPALFVWEPGVTAWDFLQPLITSVGLRFFCDERRTWRIIEPSDYLLDGFVRMTVDNSVRGTDLITREDTDVFATGVVVVYTSNENGYEDVRYDSAGSPEKVLRVDYDRPYPGPGAAAAILARRNGLGRVQDVTSLVDWTATPAMAAIVTLPETPEQQGQVSSVEFSLGEDATMRVGTRGLIEVPPGSWLDWDIAQQWQQVPDTVTWASL